jgi:hypothetical protein
MTNLSQDGSGGTMENKKKKIQPKVETGTPRTAKLRIIFEIEILNSTLYKVTYIQLR